MEKVNRLRTVVECEKLIKELDPQTAIITNYNHQDNLFRKTMIDRDAKVLEMLVKEGII